MDNSQFIDYFETKVGRHIEAIEEWGKSIEDASFFEFGTGWDMLAPIGFYLGGIGKYIAVDLNELLRPELLKHSIDLYRDNMDSIINRFGSESTVRERIKAVSDAVTGDSGDITDKLSKLGIEYHAPMDARSTGLDGDSVDYAISNLTLQHVPREDLGRILIECYRLLKKGGLLSVTADYSDHWQHADHSISVYNYMKYSEKQWKKYNPGKQYQNRLQHSDYVELIEKAGFSIVKSYPAPIRDEDRRVLEGIPLADCFKKYSKDELLIRDEHFLAIKE